MSFDADQVMAAAALSGAITRAEALMDAGTFDSDLQDGIQHARDLPHLFLDQIVSAEPELVERLHAVSNAFGRDICRLEDFVEKASTSLKRGTDAASPIRYGAPVRDLSI